MTQTVRRFCVGAGGMVVVALSLAEHEAALIHISLLLSLQKHARPIFAENYYLRSSESILSPWTSPTSHTPRISSNTILLH